MARQIKCRFCNWRCPTRRGMPEAVKKHYGLILLAHHVEEEHKDRYDEIMAWLGDQDAPVR